MINPKNLLEYTQNLSILFIEDHKDLRLRTIDILESLFKNVDGAENGEEALEIYNKYYNKHSKHYDIVLSDIQMPKLNGIELTKKIYEINPKQDIIIISAFDDAEYLLPLINMRIQRFIKKPINYEELLDVLLKTAKTIIQANSSSTQSQSSIIQLGENFIFDTKKSSLYNEDKVIYLTKYEIIFLQLLCTKIENIFSNDEIVSNYTLLDENLDTQNIRKLVSKLRKKLPKDCIESIYGVGYRLMDKS